MAILDLDNSPSSEAKKGTEPDYFSFQVAYAKRYYRHGRRREPAGAGAPAYRVVSGGIETCLPGYRVDRGNFPYWGLEFVNSGRGTVRLGGRDIELRPGSVFSYSPGLPHRIIADAVYPLKKSFVNFLPGARPPDSFAVLTKFLEGRVLQSHSPEAIRRNFEDLAEFGSREESAADAICSALIDLVLMKIAHNSTESHLAESVSFQSYRRCLDLIDTRYAEFDSISDVADAANMDVSYLCRLFKRYGDETPYRRLSRLRMNYAAGLLVREGMGVSRAAAELGYEDAFTFSRRFKALMGVSPRNFAGEETQNVSNPRP